MKQPLFFIKIITPYGTGGAENDVQMSTNRVRMRKIVAEEEKSGATAQYKEPLASLFENPDYFSYFLVNRI